MQGRMFGDMLIVELCPNNLKIIYVVHEHKVDMLTMHTAVYAYSTVGGSWAYQ